VCERLFTPICQQVGLAGATVELLRSEMRAPFVSRAHPERLLTFLAECCAGHHNGMQDLH